MILPQRKLSYVEEGTLFSDLLTTRGCPMLAMPGFSSQLPSLVWPLSISGLVQRREELNPVMQAFTDRHPGYLLTFSALLSSSLHPVPVGLDVDRPLPEPALTSPLRLVVLTLGGMTADAAEVRGMAGRGLV